MANKATGALAARALARSTSAPRRAKVTCQPEKPVCTDCGMLKCLCRPRFFAGQLLSEQDLNRLDNYIREKQKLQNRQLHGWGVVNGLEVSCDPCGSGVTVSCGYALSPCGEDIVVCQEVPVDVCALIERCREPEVQCTPYSRPGEDGCGDVEEEWILAIRFSERPTRGITALRGGGCGCGSKTGSCGGSCGGSTKGGSCGCSGSTRSSSSCGCGGKSSAANGARECRCGPTGCVPPPRGAPPECEPTVVCEEFTFEVFRKPKEKIERDPKQKAQLTGPLVERVRCCLDALKAAVPETPGDSSTFVAKADEWHLWCCTAKAQLSAYFAVAPVYQCEIVRALQALPCPDPKGMTDAAFAAAMADAYKAILMAGLEGMLACMCSALLPPCPDADPEPRVPLAALRVRRKDCTILEVCNWTPLRKFVVTAPNLAYWLGMLPFARTIRQALHKLCCSELSIRSLFPPTLIGGKSASPVMDRATSRLNPPAPEPEKTRAFAAMSLSAVRRGAAPLDPVTFVTSMLDLDAPDEKDALSDVERANMPQFLMLNQVLRPIVRSAFSSDVATLLGGIVPGADDDDSDGGMAARLGMMEERLSAQEKEIADLRAKLG